MDSYICVYINLVTVRVELVMVVIKLLGRVAGNGGKSSQCLEGKPYEKWRVASGSAVATRLGMTRWLVLGFT